MAYRINSENIERTIQHLNRICGLEGSPNAYFYEPRPGSHTLAIRTGLGGGQKPIASGENKHELYYRIHAYMDGIKDGRRMAERWEKHRQRQEEARIAIKMREEGKRTNWSSNWSR